MSERVEVEVEPWVLLYAFRYGLGRFTYAHGDVIRLARENWPALRKWRDTIERDLEMVAESEVQARPIACGNDVTARELLAWIKAEEGER